MVDANLKPVRDALCTAMETIKEPVKAVCEEQVEIRNSILAIGEFLGHSLSHGKDAKAKLQKQMDAIKQSGEKTDEKMHEVVKIVPKSGVMTVSKEEKKDEERQPKVVR